jgi:BlaI family penicillinase repressor
MTPKRHVALSSRETQIMDVIYKLGHATATEVWERLPDPPGYSAVRTMLRRLEEKEHLVHKQDGLRYVYHPVVPRSRARDSALQRFTKTFFDGSLTKMVSAILDRSATELSDAELDEIARLIEEARRSRR